MFASSSGARVAGVDPRDGPDSDHRPSWRTAGPEGNKRLTSAIGLVLLALLGTEALTTLRLRSYLPVHIFLGLLLVPPVALKLASTGWRFLRYYTNSPPYRHEGPPRLLLRVLAPILVASTLSLFGTGVALVIVGHGDGWLSSLHGVSFGIWGVVMIVHVLAYISRTLRVGTEDWRRARASVAGYRTRRVLVAGVTIAGVALALATYPAQRAWFSHRHDHRDRGDVSHSLRIGGSTTAAKQQLRPPRTDPAWVALRLPRVPRGPLPGYLLIADRNNNRLLIVSPSKRIVWNFDGLPGPDDAFFTPNWRAIVTNEEFDETLREVSLRPKRIAWTYGHAGAAGASAGYLNTPDDAYELPNGDITVADIRNCRIVELSHRRTVVRILGGSCAHNPPHGFASPNGDTPLPDGGLLVTEIGGWIDRLDRRGHLVWSVRSPVSYPSDAQLLPNGEILVASFTSPGKIVELTRTGQVTWSFGAPSGPDLLDQPSLAVRLPNGMIAANDDYNDRVILIDPRTMRIVWQYGHTGIASAAVGYLSKPDGIDFLPAALVRH